MENYNDIELSAHLTKPGSILTGNFVGYLSSIDYSLDRFKKPFEFKFDAQEVKGDWQLVLKDKLQNNGAPTVKSWSIEYYGYSCSQ